MSDVLDNSPLKLLLPYQRKWQTDESRFKLGLWARQTGKDFTSQAEVVTDCLQHPKTTWLVGAAGERQALESLAKAKEWAEAFKFSISDYAEDRAFAQALINSASIQFANGSRVVAVPANPDTVRGYSANVLLTEFAFLDNPQEVWRAIYPSISNPLRGGLKKLRIITTPNGKNGKFYDLWSKDNGYAKHKVTIHDAVAQGLPLDVEALREGLDDPEGWLQEYEVEFIDGSNTLLPYDLIALAESMEASECEPVGQPGYSRNRTFFCGIDFGRQNDPTVCWTLERVGDILWTREVLVLQTMSTPDQVRILKSRCAAAHRVSLDYTGPGVGLGDYLSELFGEHEPDGHTFGKIELCTFTSALKRSIFPNLRRAFEAPTKLRIPFSIAVREDLHAVQQIITNGNYDYRAPRTAAGHSDRCTALALAVRAANTGGGAFAYERVTKPGLYLPKGLPC